MVPVLYGMNIGIISEDVHQTSNFDEKSENFKEADAEAAATPHKTRNGVIGITREYTVLRHVFRDRV